jgi:hypothetical protein
MRSFLLIQLFLVLAFSLSFSGNFYELSTSLEQLHINEYAHLNITHHDNIDGDENSHQHGHKHSENGQEHEHGHSHSSNTNYETVKYSPIRALYLEGFSFSKVSLNFDLRSHNSTAHPDSLFRPPIVQN